MRVSLPPHLRRVERERQRFERDVGRLQQPAWGRYAPRCAFDHFFVDPSEYRVDLERDGSTPAGFRAAVERALVNRFYQPETVRKYMGCLDRFLAWLTIPPARVHRKVLACFIMDLKHKGAAASTLVLHISALRTVYDRVCGCRFTDSLYLPRSSPAPPAPAWTPEETRELLAVARDDRERLIVLCLAGLKLTLTEMLHLRPRDVRLAGSTIQVWSGLGRAEREVPVPADALAPLRRACGAHQPDEPFFPGRRGAGQPLTARAVRGILKRMAEGCGVRKVLTPSVLRRSELDLRHHQVERSDDHGPQVAEDAAAEAHPFQGRGPLSSAGITECAVLPAAGEATVTVSTVRRLGPGRVTVELRLRAGPGPPLHVTGFRARQASDGQLRFIWPAGERWREAVHWLPRGTAERFRDGAWVDSALRQIRERTPGLASGEIGAVPAGRRRRKRGHRRYIRRA